MALTLGTNCGFVTTAPTSDPEGDAGDLKTIDNYVYAIKHTLSSNSVISEIGWWCDDATEAANFEVGIYSDNEGSPNSLLFSNTTNAKGTDSGWKKATGLSFNLNAGTYWIAVQLDNTSTATHTDSLGTGGVGYSFDIGATELLSTFAETGQDTNGKVSIYAVFSEAKQSGGSSIFWLQYNKERKKGERIR